MKQTAEKNLCKIVTDFLNKIVNKRYSRHTVLGAAISESFNCTLRDVLKRYVHGRGDANWVDVLPTKTKQNNKGTQTSNKLTPIEAS